MVLLFFIFHVITSAEETKVFTLGSSKNFSKKLPGSRMDGRWTGAGLVAEK